MLFAILMLALVCLGVILGATGINAGPHRGSGRLALSFLLLMACACAGCTYMLMDAIEHTAPTPTPARRGR